MTGTAAGRTHLLVVTDADQRGGAEVNLSRVLAALPPSIDVTLVGPDARVLDWLAGHRAGTRTEVLAAVRKKTDVRGMRAHRALFVRLRPDIVQFNLSTASSCQWAIAVACTVPGLRCIAVENSPMAVWSSTSGRLKRLTAPRLAAHVAVGERTARLIEDTSGLPAGSIATLYHGLPDVRHEPTARPDGPTMVTVARHDPVKGVDVLLEAAARTSGDVHFVVIGDGPESDRLHALATRLGLDDRVEFRVMAWNEPASDVMWAFDALVLPSRLEGFPVTIMEAMLAGLPVVATDVGSVREAIEEGVTGWIVPPEDPAALAAAIDAVAADLPAARRMGAAARAVALDRFSVDRTVAGFVGLYEQALGRPV